MYVLLHGVNASGLSAFNKIERRMSPLSQDIAGLSLKHDTYGTHLDANGNTVDTELEKKNFFAAAEVLSNVWSNIVIDGHDVDATAVPLACDFEPPVPSPEWISKHVLQCRYSLQVVKCADRMCCEAFSTNCLSFSPNVSYHHLPSISTDQMVLEPLSRRTSYRRQAKDIK